MPKKVDANQKVIVAAFRQMGATVLHLHMVGKGCPDVVIGFNRKNYLVEIKDGDKPPSARKLTPDEVEFHNSWRGQVAVVESVAGAVDFIFSIK